MTRTNKNELTQKLESYIRRTTSKLGTFVCPEVTVGFGMKQQGRVDYMTVDTKHIVRCYEIKSSVSDFRSKAEWTFVGHYNYFVMPKDIYEKVKNEIPDHVGVYTFNGCVKKPKKQEVPQEMMYSIMMSMVRSLSRDANKLYSLENPRVIEQYENRIANLQRERDQWRRNSNEMNNEVWRLKRQLELQQLLEDE